MGPLGERYGIIAPIGAGTAANVFRVRDQRSGVVRAAKVLKPENAAEAGILARFENEYRILRNLHHPHLPEVYDYGRTGEGGRFLIMELVDGEPLDAYFKARPRELWVILYQLCEILTFIHNHDLLHQDVKPTNILVKRTTAFGDELPLVKLIDFGVTYRRDAGERAEMVGTPDYIAPEVALGETPLTRAVDHYSLGVTLYELLVGHVPFKGSVGEVLRAHVEQEPIIEHEELEWAELYPHVRGLLAKDKKTRLAAFEELRRAVVTRLTGGITALDRAYGAARIESMGMIGKRNELRAFLDATLPGETDDARPWRVSVSGQPLSGRGHFLDEARSEWQIRGVASWQLGENSDAAWLFNRPADVTGPPTEKDFEQAWARVSRVAADGPAWVVASADLTPDEARLYEYFETGRTLAGPDVRRNLGFVTATAADRGRPEAESDEVSRVTLPTLTTDDVEGVLGQFRGEMLRGADTQLLADVLKGLRESGEVILLLRRLIAEDGLTFEAQRWRVAAERVHAIARAPVPRGGHLTLPLAPAQKQLMVCLASHPGPVPVGWLPDLSGLDDTDAVKALHDLRLRHLLEPVDLHGTAAVRTTSRAVEQAVLRNVKDTELRGIHAHYVQKLSARALSASLATSDRLRTLALHQERSGDERGAYRTRRELFKELWKKRAYGEIEQICRDAMAPETLRFGLARAYLRELVKVLWAQNLTTRAYHDMKAFADRYGEVPKGLLPKYARGLMDALGPQAAEAHFDRMLASAGQVSQAMLARLRLEYALLCHNLSHYEQGRNVAALVEAMLPILSRQDICRLRIYQGLLQPSLTSPEADRYIAEAQEIAEREGFFDDLAMISSMRSIQYANAGKPALAVSVAASSMRTVTRNRLLLRQYQLYSQVALAYSELGDHARAIRYRSRTVSIAQYLGSQALLANAWFRLAYYSDRYGLFGNAMRFYDRATPLLQETSKASDFMIAGILQHDLHVTIGSDRAGELEHVAQKALAESSDVGERGTNTLVGADQLLRAGEYEDAIDRFRSARALCQEARRVDDAARSMAREAVACTYAERLDEASSLLDSVRRSIEKIANIETRAAWLMAELEFWFRTRHPQSEIIAVLQSCEELTDRLQMTTKLELLPAMARCYARMGKMPEMKRTFLRYEEEVRMVVANLEDPTIARGFLQTIRYREISQEFRTAISRSARTVSVGASAS